LKKIKDNLSEFHQESGYTKSDNGFILRILRREEIKAVITVNEIAFSEYLDKYLNLALSIMNLSILPIENARKFKTIVKKTLSLERALSEVKTLQGLLPICANCKKVRDDEGLWTKIDEYLTSHTDAQFSHSLCPDCARELYPEYTDTVIKKMK
jgi:hypothetical protein